MPLTADLSMELRAVNIPKSSLLLFCCCYSPHNMISYANFRLGRNTASAMLVNRNLHSFVLTVSSHGWGGCAIDFFLHYDYHLMSNKVFKAFASRVIGRWQGFLHIPRVEYATEVGLKNWFYEQEYETESKKKGYVLIFFLRASAYSACRRRRHHRRLNHFPTEPFTTLEEQNPWLNLPNFVDRQIFRLFNGEMFGRVLSPHEARLARFAGKDDDDEVSLLWL